MVKSAADRTPEPGSCLSVNGQELSHGDRIKYAPDWHGSNLQAADAAGWPLTLDYLWAISGLNI